MTKLYHINLIEVNNMDLLYSVLSGLITTFLIYIVSRFFKYYKYLSLLFNKYRYYYQNIRFSIAYLYRIKIDDQYLLIKGNRIEQFQPIGGVYKYYESFLSLKELYEVKSDNPQNFCEGNDLRIIVPNTLCHNLNRQFPQTHLRNYIFLLYLLELVCLLHRNLH